MHIDDLLVFREKTRQLRKDFFSETQRQIEKEIAGASSQKVQKIAINTSDAILKGVEKYQAEMAQLKDKLWPNLVGAIGSKTTLAGIAALGASVILSPASMILASIPTLVEPAKVVLKWSADMKKIKRKASTTIAYLSAINQQIAK